MVTDPNPARILLVDDDQIFIERVTSALEPMALLRTTRTGRSALSVAEIWRPDVILLDLLLDDLDGFTFLERLSETGMPRLPFILCTTDGYGADTRIRPLPNWRVGTLVRSSSRDELRSAVFQAVQCQDPLRQRWLAI